MNVMRTTAARARLVRATLFAFACLFSCSNFVPDESFFWGPGAGPTTNSGPWGYELGSSGSGGGVSNSINTSTRPSLAIDPGSGGPVVAWSESWTGMSEIHLRRWDGASWQELGGSATGGGVSGTAGPSLFPSVAVDSNGWITVAWEEEITGGNREIYVKRWDWAGWQELNFSGRTGGISNSVYPSLAPSLMLDYDGSPIVAWSENFGTTDQIYLLKWDGTSSTWVGMNGSGTWPGISGANSNAHSPRVARTPGGSYFAAWLDNYSSSNYLHLRADGAPWYELGSSATGSGVSAGAIEWGCLDLAADTGGSLWAAWSTLSDASVYARRWDGAQWREEFGSMTGTGIGGITGCLNPSLACDSTSRVAVAWDQQTGANPWERDICLRALSPTVGWVEIGGPSTFGTGSASNGGVSRTQGSSLLPSLAYDGAGRLFVAWQEDVNGNWEIYVRRDQP